MSEEDLYQAKIIADHFRTESGLAADERLFIKLVDALSARDATIAEQAATINMMSGQLKFHRDSTDAKDKRIEELKLAVTTQRERSERLLNRMPSYQEANARIADLESKLEQVIISRDETISDQESTIAAKDKRIAELRNALSEYVLLVDFATLNGFAKLDPAALERHQAVKQSLLTQD